MHTEIYIVVDYLLTNQIQLRLENDGEAQSYLWLADGYLILNNSDGGMDLFYKGLEIYSCKTGNAMIIKLKQLKSSQERTDRLRTLTETHGM